MGIFSDYDEIKLKEFLDTVRPWGAAYADATFGFVGIRNGAEIDILHGHLILPNAGPRTPQRHFETNSVVGGLFRLADFGKTYENILFELSTGILDSPYGKLRLPPNADGRISASFIPYPFGFANAQLRITKFSLVGAQGDQMSPLEAATLELQAAATPYDSLEELAREFSVIGFRRDITLVDVTADNVAVVDTSMRVVGTRADLAVLLARHLDPKECSLGYKVLVKGEVINRNRVLGDELLWEEKETHWIGSKTLTVPQGAMLQCFASYKGCAQHHGWIADPDTFPNVLRVLHHGFDTDLQVLRTYLLDEKHQQRYSRDFEAGMANLLFLLGFSVDPLIGKPLEDGPDIIATTKSGNVVLMECTTGQINKDGKLGKLVGRAEVVRSHLEKAAYQHLKVLPVIVTSRPRNAVAEIGVARRQGVLVVTQEDLAAAIDQTLVFQDSDVIFTRGWDSLHQQNYGD